MKSTICNKTQISKENCIFLIITYAININVILWLNVVTLIAEPACPVPALALTMAPANVLIIGYLNIRGQSGMNLVKQLQIEAFVTHAQWMVD